MGYDFHLDNDGPKLIEVNTNAGGAFLNALLARAQKACCAELDQGVIGARDDEFETRVVAMFEDEWRRQRGAGSPRRIAIIDDRPEEQYARNPQLALGGGGGMRLPIRVPACDRALAGWICQGGPSL